MIMLTILLSINLEGNWELDAILKYKHDQAFIDLTGSSFSIHHEGELNDLLSMCYLHNTNIILLAANNLSDVFFNLKSGLAGAALQKFANYQVKVAVLLPEKTEHGDRFKELMSELNKSNHFRFYLDRTSAETWLVAK